ncbi:MAG TPA: hypothetical protein VJ921_09540 [Vicinamibacteria bacterium]|nr:hypothetical protein [Vicinamibacteria bacterium]
MQVQPSENAKSARTFRILLLSISLIASAAFGFRAKVEPLGRGIDSSYMFAANYASSQGWRFGERFVSTYGPYGYLIYASNVADIPVRKLVSELVLVVLVGVACASYVASYGLGTGAALGASLLLVYTVHVQGNSDFGDEYRWFSLILLLVLNSLRAPRVAGLLTFLLAAFFGGFFLLVKLSLGAGALMTISAACLLTRNPSVAASRIGLLSIGAPLGFAVAWLAHQGTLEGAVDYFFTAADLVSGYSSAMSGASGWREMALCFGAFTAILGGIALSSPRSCAAVTLLVCGVPLFVVWKHTMVLGTPNHTKAFVLFGSLILSLILVPFLGSKRPWTAALLVVPAVFLFAPWLHFRAEQTGGIRSLGERLAEPLLFPGRLGWDQLRSTLAGSSGAPRKPARAFDRLRLPDSVRARIADEPIDIYPWESLYIAANDFSWANRPSTASFATFSPGLDRRNTRFLASAAAPNYVLWHLDRDVLSIQRRHVFWDEPETLRTLVGSYTLDSNEDEGETVLLLKKLAGPRLSSPRPLREDRTQWGEWTDVPPSDGVVFARLRFERPWWTRLATLLLRDAPMYISVRFESGEEETYRFVPAQAGSGLWMSPLPRDAAEVRSTLSGDFSRPRARAIRIHGSWEDEQRSSVDISWLEAAPSRD